MEDIRESSHPHKLTMTNRKSSFLSGVKDVLSFDEQEILLETECGMLMIRGENLHVNRLSLDQGEVELEGQIDSYQYSAGKGSSTGRESLLQRLFR